MTSESGVVASAMVAPLIDGRRQTLVIAHRSRYACQLADRDGRVVLAVMTRDAVRLPHGAVVPSLPRGASPVSVGDGSLGWDGCSMRVARWFRPARPALPALRRRIDDPTIARFAAQWSESLGRGDGLTPYHDDVVCGVLVTLHAAGHRLAPALCAAVADADLESRTTAVSAALLRAGARGYCIDPLAVFLGALACDTASAETARRQDAALTALLAVGHSSGRGLVEGALTALGRSGAAARAA